MVIFAVSAHQVLRRSNEDVRREERTSRPKKRPSSLLRHKEGITKRNHDKISRQLVQSRTAERKKGERD